MITLHEAREEAVRLLRPFGVSDQYRIESYAEIFSELHDAQVLHATVGTVLRSHAESWPPSIGQIVEAYRLEVRRSRDETPALGEPDLTAEQRRENVRKARVLLEQVEGELDLDDALREVAREQ
jgi:hypothetical protein